MPNQLKNIFSLPEKKPDILLFLVFLSLCTFGLLILLGVNAQSSNPYKFFFQQLFSFLVGSILFVIGLEIKLSFLRSSAFVAVIASFFLMTLVFLPGIGHARGQFSNVPRWIGIPLPGLGNFSFQPVEIAKVAIILYLSHYLNDRNPERKELLKKSLTFVLIGGIIILTALQPNFGSAIILVLISVNLIFISGIRWKSLFLSAVTLLPLIAIALVVKPYRSDRILVWLDPYHHTAKAFQILESFRAFFEGGWTGNIIGMGRAHRLLPDRHNDFIFAIVANDFGFLGVLFVISLFLIFTWRSVFVLRFIQDPFYRTLGYGLVYIIIVQTILNMSVVTGLLPTTGISLPFISLGGSNLVINMFSMGLVLNITAQEKTSNY